MAETSPRTTHEHDEQTANQEKPKRLDLSPVQILGGSAAAATAAALGSGLGVGGTVLGAAIASVIAAVAGSIYTASLQRTTHGVRKVLVRRPASAAPDKSGWDRGVVAKPIAPAREVTRSTHRPRRRLLPIVVGAVAVFATAAIAVTGFEALLGRSLSGGTGTTVQQVSRDNGPAGDSGDQDPGSTTDESPTADESNGNDSTQDEGGSKEETDDGTDPQTEQGQGEQGQGEENQPEQGQSGQGQSGQGQSEQGQSEQQEEGQPEQNQSEQDQPARAQQGQADQGTTD